MHYIHMQKNSAAVLLGKRGGEATKKKMGKGYYSKIAKMRKKHESVRKPIQAD